MGLLQRLGRLLAAPDIDRRSQITYSQIAVQPIEVCELRVMLSATTTQFDDSDFELNLLSDVNFHQQLFNADQFVDAVSHAANVTSVITLVDGVPVQRPEGGLALLEANDEIVGRAHGPTNFNTTGRVNDYKNAIGEELDRVTSAEVQFAESDHVSSTEPVRHPTEQSDNAPDRAEVQTDGLALQGVASDYFLTVGLDSYDESFSDSDSVYGQPSGDTPEPSSAKDPTTVTVIIQTDEGIVVLHQTSDLDDSSVTRSAGFQAASQIVNRLVQQQRDERSSEVLAPRISSTVLPSPTSNHSELDSVFADSRLLLNQLVEAASQSQDTSTVSNGTEAVELSTNTALSTVIRYGIPVARGANTMIVLGLTSEVESQLPPARQIRRDLSWTQQTRSAASTRRSLTDGSLVLQLFPAVASREEELSHAELLIDQAREAAQPITTTLDVRHEDLLRTLILSAAFGGESWDTVPLLVPQQLPDIPVIESLATTLLHSIHPRGPPHTQLPEGFSRHEAIRLQHNVLKHSIVPRSPSICFFN